jgi:hypothetical protein
VPLQNTPCQYRARYMEEPNESKVLVPVAELDFRGSSAPGSSYRRCPRTSRPTNFRVGAVGAFEGALGGASAGLGGRLWEMGASPWGASEALEGKCAPCAGRALEEFEGLGRGAPAEDSP